MHLKRTLLASGAWLGAALAGAPALAQTSSTQSNTTSQAEKQRGVPGVDVDLNTKEKSTNNGMPGVDVDTNKSRDRDMKASGAGAATMDRTDNDAGRTNTRAARADRN